MMLLKRLTSVAFATFLASLLGLAMPAWVMGQTKTDTEARSEIAKVLQKKVRDGQKDGEDLALPKPLPDEVIRI